MVSTIGKKINDKIKFVDTNILLSNLDTLQKEKFFLLSSVTITELENIKVSKNKTDEIRYNARKAVRFLNDNSDKYKVIVYDSKTSIGFESYGLEDSNDNKIIKCAEHAKNNLDFDLVFVTNDILCRLIAQVYFKLDVMSLVEKENIYKGYKVIHGNSNQINFAMENMNMSEWNVNEYLIIQNTDDNSEKEMRFDGEKFVALKLPPSKFIKAKNSLQRCALDILNNQDITIAAILGGYGSGKTFLSLQMALYNVNEKGNQSKILGVRSPQGEGKEVGFLPGDLTSKIQGFFEPLTQQLNGGEFELESLKQRGVLDCNIPFYMKGTTYNDTIMVVDEAEDLDEKQIRLVGTRVGSNSRIYFAGDYKQSVVNATKNNGLIKMCNEFKGNRQFATIYLGEDVRSSTSKMFANLFTE